MNFLYPAFLWALAALAIPVVIHFFNFRTYKTVYFSNLSFLMRMRKEQKSRSKLQQWLVLLARLLAVAALVLAFAQPYIPVKNEGARKQAGESLVALYIDNSFSMNAENDRGQLLAAARGKAMEIVRAYPATTRFYLLTNDFHVQNQRWLAQTEVLKRLQSIQESPVPRKISQVYNRQSDFFSRETAQSPDVNRIAYWISDFQQHSADLPAITGDSLTQVQLLQLKAGKTSNIYIDSCWFKSPSRKYKQEETLYVRVINTSVNEQFEDIPIKLSMNGSLRAMGNISLPPESEVVQALEFTAQSRGDLMGELSLNDYPITYDNTLYFNYELSDVIRVAFIGDTATNPLKYLLGDEILQFTALRPGQVKPSELAQYQAIFLATIDGLTPGLGDQLAGYTRNGGSLVLLPSANTGAERYNRLLQKMATGITIQALMEEEQTVGSINFEHELYAAAFEHRKENLQLPRLGYFFPLSLAPRSKAEALIRLRNDDPLMAGCAVDKGRVFVSGIPFHEENSAFMRHPLMVPSYYNMAFYSQARDPLFYTIRDNVQVELPLRQASSSDIYKVSGVGHALEFIPAQTQSRSRGRIKLNMRDNIRKAGYYNIRRGGETIKKVSFNYHRAESELQYWDKEELNKQIAQNGLKGFSYFDAPTFLDAESLERQAQGQPLWRWFLFAALCFLLAEILFIRLLRYNF